MKIYDKNGIEREMTATEWVLKKAEKNINNREVIMKIINTLLGMMDDFQVEELFEEELTKEGYWDDENETQEATDEDKIQHIYDIFTSAFSPQELNTIVEEDLKKN